MKKNQPLCNAPFANMYIDGDGNITPCCFNRDDVLGNIYSDDLETIWKGETSLRIRKQLLQHKFPDGCHLCKKMLEQGNYYNSGIYTYQKLNYKKSDIQSIDFELSYFCNLSCIICNLHTKNYQLTTEQEALLLNKLKPLIPKLKKVRFYGGEPFIIPIYHKLWEAIIEINPACNILLQTNGMHLDEAFELLAGQGNFTINVSLDSLNAENLSNIRKGANLSLILKNISRFKKISKKPVSLTVTPMRMNRKEIPALVRFANKNRLQVFFNTLIQPKKYSLWTLPNDALLETLNYYSSFSIFPFSLNRFFNKIKYKHFVNQVKYEYKVRPHYSENELKNNINEIISSITDKIQKQHMDENAVKQFLYSYLQFHKKEDVLDFISSVSEDELIQKIQSLLSADNR
jgi:radical SAM protein with 4Fe4S-binding SPASM domain